MEIPYDLCQEWGRGILDSVRFLPDCVRWTALLYGGVPWSVFWEKCSGGV